MDDILTPVKYQPLFLATEGSRCRVFSEVLPKGEICSFVHPFSLCYVTFNQFLAIPKHHSLSLWLIVFFWTYFSIAHFQNILSNIPSELKSVTIINIIPPILISCICLLQCSDLNSPHKNVDW